jgi:hypothetical protein
LEPDNLKLAELLSTPIFDAFYYAAALGEGLRFLLHGDTLQPPVGVKVVFDSDSPHCDSTGNEGNLSHGCQAAAISAFLRLQKEGIIRLTLYSAESLRDMDGERARSLLSKDEGDVVVFGIGQFSGKADVLLSRVAEAQWKNRDQRNFLQVNAICNAVLCVFCALMYIHTLTLCSETKRTQQKLSQVFATTSADGDITRMEPAQLAALSSVYDSVLTRSEITRQALLVRAPSLNLCFTAERNWHGALLGWVAAPSLSYNEPTALQHDDKRVGIGLTKKYLLD